MRASLMAQPKNSPVKQETQETWVWSLCEEDPLERKLQPTPVFLPGKSHGQRSMVGYGPWGGKESDTTEWLSVHAPANKRGRVNLTSLHYVPSAKWAYQHLPTVFPDGSVAQDPPANAGNAGSIPGPRGSLGVGNGNPLQYSCLGSSMDRGAWRAIVHGVTKSWTWLSNWACMQRLCL